MSCCSVIPPVLAADTCGVLFMELFIVLFMELLRELFTEFGERVELGVYCSCPFNFGWECKWVSY